MPAIIHLFEIEGLEEQGSPYHHPALRLFFESLLAVDEKATMAFELRQGDLLLDNLAYAPSRVRLEHHPDGSTSIATHKQGDVDLYATLIWDFCDALEDRWHSTDSAQLTRALSETGVYALAASALDLDSARRIDLGLRDVPYYLGAFELDPGNPVQQRVTGGGLINDLSYRDRTLIFDPWQSDNPADPPPLDPHEEEWFNGLEFAEVRYMTSEELISEQKTAPWPTGELSSRGRRSQEVLRQRSPAAHMQRLASELGSIAGSEGAEQFDIEMSVMPRAGDAVVEEAKLVRYLLDPESPEGSAKAKFFKETLGIEAGEWRHLAAQLKQGLAKAPVLNKVRSGQWGVRYEVVTNIRGLNGSLAAVLSAWQVEPNEPPRFITAHPAPKEHRSKAGPAPEICVVTGGLEGDERWAELWHLADEAGTAAGAAMVPTPLRVDGHSYSQGMFGGGRVIVPDARRGFARWLVRSEKGYLREQHGAVVSAPDSSADRARAYAEAFAEILTLNGVECDTEHNLT
jgi:hypothetical protein